MITEDLIPKIEKVFGFPLYDWQKAYLLGKINYCVGGRKNGKVFAYCLNLLLPDGEPISKIEVLRYRDEEHETSYHRWFRDYCLKINDIITKNGIKTRIIN